LWAVVKTVTNLWVALNVGNIFRRSISLWRKTALWNKMVQDSTVKTQPLVVF